MSRSRRSRLLVLTALLAASLGVAAPLPIAVDPMPLRALLVARDFDALEARFAAARAARDSHEPTALLWKFEHLASSEHIGLEAWVDERPDSVSARLALGYRELRRAWEVRGAGPSAGIGADARYVMRVRLERSLALAADVTDRDPRWLDARALQIRASQLLGDAFSAQDAFEAALAVDPSHYGVWLARQRLLLSEWGGSYEAQEEVARAAQAHADRNPRLRRLLASADVDRARGLWRAGRLADAFAAYERAIEHADDGPSRADRAGLRAALGDFAGAQAELERGLAIDPYYAALHAGLSRRCMAERDFACMRDAAVRAVALEPANSEHQKLLAFAEWAVEKPAAAVRQLDNHPVQNWLSRHQRWLYLHAFESAALAAALGIVWYLLRARRRRRRAAEHAVAPIPRVPEAPGATPARPSTLERLPRTGVWMIRAFLWFGVVRFVLYYSGRLHPGTAQPLLLAEIGMSVMALAGALGFAYGLRLGRAWIWKAWTVAYPIWTQWLAIGPHGFTWEQWSIWGFWHLMLLPVYASLFFYGFRCAALWQGGRPGPGWTAPARRSPQAMPARPSRG